MSYRRGYEDPQDRGMYFQHALQERLQFLAEHRPVYWHRFTDTREAGRVTKKAPGDFMLMTGGVATLLEAKSSIKHKTFTTCFKALIKPGQPGEHAKWLRGEGEAFFLFYSHVTDLVEVWPSGLVRLAYRGELKLTGVHMETTFELDKLGWWLMDAIRRACSHAEKMVQTTCAV